MHIPDGFLDLNTCLGTYCVAGAGLSWATHQSRARWSDRTVPMMGIMSAFVFAGQMINFPVAGGTSGHLLGGVLAAVFLGPCSAAMVIATVLAVQCLLFQDGGVTTLGANLVNLALLACFGGYVCYRFLLARTHGPRGLIISCGVAAWFSVVLASMGCALQLGTSGTAPLRLVFPAMVLTHAVIGVGEALITASVVSFVLKVRPDLLRSARPHTAGPHLITRRKQAVGMLLFFLGLILLLSPVSSSLPDGLESVANTLGFGEAAQQIFETWMPDYAVREISLGWLSTLLAAAIGTFAAFGLIYGIGHWLHRPPKQPHES